MAFDSGDGSTAPPFRSFVASIVMSLAVLAWFAVRLILRRIRRRLQP